MAPYGADLSQAHAQRPNAPALKKMGSQDLRQGGTRRQGNGGGGGNAKVQQLAVQANESIEAINKQVVYIRGKLKQATVAKDIVPTAKACVYLLLFVSVLMWFRCWCDVVVDVISLCDVISNDEFATGVDSIAPSFRNDAHVVAWTSACQR